MDVSSIIAVMTKSVFRHCQMSPEGQNCPSVKKHYCKQISNSVMVSISNRKWREICMSILQLLKVEIVSIFCWGSGYIPPKHDTYYFKLKGFEKMAEAQRSL